MNVRWAIPLAAVMLVGCQRPEVIEAKRVVEARVGSGATFSNVRPASDNDDSRRPKAVCGEVSGTAGLPADRPTRFVVNLSKKEAWLDLPEEATGSISDVPGFAVETLEMINDRSFEVMFDARCHPDS